jgi:magnesium transporter
MPNKASVIGPEIEEILKSANKEEQIREMFADMHPYDIFVLCEDMEDLQVAECVKALGIPAGISVFEEFDDNRKKGIFNCFSKEWMADILEEMAPDERADFVKRLPEEKLEEVLPLVARAERIDIKKLITYEEHTAGAILTTEYASLSPGLTVKDALEKVKLQAFDRETIYYVYVIDENRVLLGFVSLRDLIVAPSSKRVAEIMHRNVISAHLNDDKEAVAKKLSDYNFLAIPIVDNDNRLVGIVTVDDVIEVVEEETTEDIYRLAAAGEYMEYKSSNPWHMARQRAMWLMILVCVGFVSAFVLRHNEVHLEAVVALSFFIPMLLGSGGNAGTQSATVVVRGLATGGIEIDDLLYVWRKEVSVGLIMGAFMAAVSGLLAMFLNQNPLLGATVGLAMVCNVVLATSLGALLPILFKRFRLDPALMSGPFITSIVDISGLLIYFKIAMMIFNM